MKVAFSRLVVSLLSLVTVVVALATSILKLVVTAVGVLTSWLERAGVKKADRIESITETPRANLRVLPAQSSKAAELTRALTGLGFVTPEVKRFVTTLSDETLKQDIRDLIKAGLKALSAAA
jgi:Holliday junction resolvasome RuvABC DNA-binding subunit